MTRKTYNPYNAVKSISDLKGMYHTAKDLGMDYDKYQKEAEQYYQELMQNGYTDVAEELTANDYIGSLDILGRYKPDKEFKVDTAYESIMKDAADIGSGRTTSKASDSVQEILDSFKNTDSMLNGSITTDKSGNVTSGLNLDYYNKGSSRLDELKDFDYTKQPYYESIMESYGLEGDKAAQGELASGASGNSGNIDSYAAANANRQSLSFKNAGHQAAQAAAQQNQQNWQALYEAMGGRLSDIGALNAQNLGTGANMFDTDSSERRDALAAAAGLADSKSQRIIDRYLAEMADQTERYRIDKETERAKELAYINNAAALEQLEKEIEAGKHNEQIEALLSALGYKTSNGSPLMDEKQAYKALYSGRNDRSLAEMKSLVGETIEKMKTGDYDGLYTFDDVKETVLDLFPQYEKEIDKYIEEYQKQELGQIGKRFLR